MIETDGVTLMQVPFSECPAGRGYPMPPDVRRYRCAPAAEARRRSPRSAGAGRVRGNPRALDLGAASHEAAVY